MSGPRSSLHVLVGGGEVTASLGAEVVRLAGFRALARGRFGWRVVDGAGARTGAADWADRF